MDHNSSSGEMALMLAQPSGGGGGAGCAGDGAAAPGGDCAGAAAGASAGGSSCAPAGSAARAEGKEGAPAAHCGGGGGGGCLPSHAVAGVAPGALADEGGALLSLGPAVVNKDGTLSRITNWHTMTAEEQDTALRLVARRNAARRAALSGAADPAP